MERTKKSKTDKIRWIKRGGGSFELNNQMIKENQPFIAAEWEIPEPFRDLCEPVNPRQLKKVTPPTPPPPVEYKKEPADNGELDAWNVMDNNGKQVNDSPLTGKEADELIKSLM